MELKAQRVQFEKWHKREFPTCPVEWQEHLGRYFYGQVQTRWEAYTAGAADARVAENEAWLVECKPKDNSTDWMWLCNPVKSELRARKQMGVNPAYAYRITPLIRARQETK